MRKKIYTLFIFFCDVIVSLGVTPRSRKNLKKFKKISKKLWTKEILKNSH